MRKLKFAIFLAAATLLGAATTHAQTCPFPAPVLVAPSDGATKVTSPVTFKWNAVPGANGYYLWAKTDDEVDFTLIDATSGTTAADDVPPNAAIEWYVEANFDSCANGVASTHFRFTSLGCPDVGPTLVSPADGATGVQSPVTFSWLPVDRASGYRIWIIGSKDADFFVLDDTERTSIAAPLPPDVYAWFVESFFDGCESTFSDLARFTIPKSANCPTVGPALLAPAPGASVPGPVTFSWTAVAGAIGYDVQAALDDGEFDTVAKTEGETTAIADIGSGTVRWKVVAHLNGCDDVESAEATFTIPFDPSCDHSSPLLISPADGESNVPLAVDFIWTPVDGATGYDVWITVNGGVVPQNMGSSPSPRLRATVPAGEISWYVESHFASCPSDFSPENVFNSSAGAACTIPAAPDIYVDPEAMSGDLYYLIFSPGLNTSSYQVEEATKANFSDAVTRATTDVLLTLSHNVTVATRYYYRVRSVSSCGLGLGPWSSEASTVVTPNVAQSADDPGVVASYGTMTPIVQTIHIPGPAVTGKAKILDTFTITSDKPWITVSPSTGTIGPEGLDIKVTADPKVLSGGTNTGTIHLTTSGITAVTPVSVNVPVSVSLVTPVTPNPGTTPLPNSLIIPALGHAQGAGAKFESDVRITNASAQTMKYLLSFTPTLSDGTKTGQQATIQVDAGNTIALNDILKNFYGFATATDSMTGVLEIRPLTNSGSGATFASSRTYATTAIGTLGQFVPAIPYSAFVGRGKDPNKPIKLSLQQVAQSAAFRTNIGLVEASGEPASGTITVLGDSNQQIAQFPFSLKPGEQMQFGLGSKGISNLPDGRVEVAVTSPTGRVTAYASVLDNRTQDPLLVFPVNTTEIAPAKRYVLPGVGDFDLGIAHWKSDVRIFNASDSPAPATLTYVPQGRPDLPRTTTISLQPNEVRVIDNFIATLFPSTATAGSLVVTTPGASSLVVTARTYTDTGSGTYGQFIPAVKSTDGIGGGDRPLQVLQAEDSERFHTNLGIFELTGNPVTVEVTAYVPDSRVTVKTGPITLAGNEFRQFGSALHTLLGYSGNVYNARMTVKVIGGTGRVSAYGSLIDNTSLDPTYVPAQ